MHTMRALLEEITRHAEIQDREERLCEWDMGYVAGIAHAMMVIIESDPSLATAELRSCARHQDIQACQPDNMMAGGRPE